MAYIPRLTAPAYDDLKQINIKYGGGLNHALTINKATGSVLPNCTGYVHFRALELCGAEIESKLCLYNAVAYFDYTADGLERGQTPRLGAIAVWSGGSKGYGHVAVVETLYSDGSFLCSNSNYSGTRFYTKRVYAPSYQPWSGYKLLGFIYLPWDKPLSYVGTPVARDSERRQLEVKFTNLNARTGAGTDNSVLGTISPGIYNIEGSSENVYTWYEVSDANSKRYFIADVGGSVVLLSYIEYVGTPDGEDKTVDQVFINYEKLRARTSSGTSGEIAGYINRGFYDVDAASKERADGYDWYLLNGKYRVAIVQGSSEFIKATLKLYDIIVKGASAGDKNTIVTQAEKLGLKVEVREL